MRLAGFIGGKPIKDLLRFSVRGYTKICPNSTILHRSFPHCEFASCPTDETANWQTYRNENLAFELKYPNEPSWNYKVESEGTLVEIYNPDKGGFNVSYASHYDASLKRNWAAEDMVNSIINGRNLHESGQEIVLDGLKGTRLGYYSGLQKITEIIIQKENDPKIYRISIEINKPNDLSAETLFDQILSTFKFTPLESPSI